MLLGLLKPPNDWKPTFSYSNAKKSRKMKAFRRDEPLRKEKE
jgi:hypothetical protein